MKKRLLALTFCVLVTFLAGCNYDNKDAEKSSSEAVTSVPISSEVSSEEALISSEPISSENVPSEPTSSNSVVSEVAVKPTPPKSTGSSGFVARSGNITVAAKVSDTKKFTSSAVKWQERPMKEPASTDWKVSHESVLYNKEQNKTIYDADGDPVYSAGHLYFSYNLNFSSGNVEVGAPAAFYRYENGGWVLLNEKSANEITEPEYFSSPAENTMYTPWSSFGDVLTKGGKYMMEKQINGKLVSFKFSVVENDEWDATWQSPISTNATVTFEKDAYPIGTEAIPVILNTGNGVVGGGDLQITLYKLENDGWKAIYQPVPQTIGVEYPQGTIYNDQARVKGYLDEAGKYKLRAHYAEGVENELIFTVE